MRTPISMLAITLVFVSAVQAKDDDRAAWLKRHATPLASIDPANEDFKDLQPLKKILKGVRLVQLGEETHSDGACFLAKTRLIKFLHQEMGFDVLAFESGMYDCDKGWRNLLADPTNDHVDHTGILRIWTLSHEVKPLLAYLRRCASSKKPLELCGFDCQIAQTSRKYMKDELAEAAAWGDENYKKTEGWTRVSQCLDLLFADKPTFTSQNVRKGKQGLDALSTLLQSKAAIQNAPPRRRTFLVQLLKSLSTQLDVRFKQSSSSEDISRRDRQMAENLIWLADEQFKERKIIVWAATSHLRSHHEALKPARGDDSTFARFVPMGDDVRKHFGEQSYVLGFTAYEGKLGLPWSKPRDLGPPPPDSFEAVCFKAGLENAVIDFRSADEEGSWLREPFVARPLGYSPMHGPWAQVMDGLLYQRAMTPSTKEGYLAPSSSAAPGGDMLALLEQSWSNIEAGLKRGAMWANKWTFDDAYEKWKGNGTPSAADIQTQEDVVRKFMEKYKTEEQIVWRAHYLLGHMAKARGDGKAAGQAYEEALATFPKKDTNQPEKTSQYQHIVNFRAFQMIDQKQRKQAIKWATDLLAKDRRFRFFWAPDWYDKDPTLQKPLLKALRKAYKKRKRKFKDLEREIDRFLAQLG